MSTASASQHRTQQNKDGAAAVINGNLRQQNRHQAQQDTATRPVDADGGNRKSTKRLKIRTI